MKQTQRTGPPIAVTFPVLHDDVGCLQEFAVSWRKACFELFCLPLHYFPQWLWPAEQPMTTTARALKICLQKQLPRWRESPFVNLPRGHSSTLKTQFSQPPKTSGYGRQIYNRLKFPEHWKNQLVKWGVPLLHFLKMCQLRPRHRAGRPHCLQRNTRQTAEYPTHDSLAPPIPPFLIHNSGILIPTMYFESPTPIPILDLPSLKRSVSQFTALLFILASYACPFR